ncbi:MAG: hypothetical protein H0X31_07245 [Nostocaceae cyanobacterium]|nr:hypothetical protein [Nostocaceae cyanobacterium]
MPAGGRQQASGLRPECLSFFEIIAQSIANIAPSAVVLPVSTPGRE